MAGRTVNKDDKTKTWYFVLKHGKKVTVKLDSFKREDSKQNKKL